MSGRVLVNGTTLVVGGGIQIGVSFIEFACGARDQALDLVFALSPAVFDELPNALRLDERLRIVPESPAKPIDGLRARAQLRQIERQFQPDVVYSLGFPSYVRFRAPEIGRYTNPWEIVPNSLAWSTIARRRRATQLLKIQYRLSWARRARYFETQTETAKRGIVRSLNVPAERVVVVPNSPNPRFLRAGIAAGEARPIGRARILCLAAAYPHKNLTFIPNVADQVRRRHAGTECIFVLTLPMDSRLYLDVMARSRALGVDHMIENLGPIGMDECVAQYEECSAVFLPTLLEVFSVTYVEAMAMARPIVTSDLDFARETCGDAALYYDPRSAERAADALAAVICDTALRTALVARGKKRLAAFPAPDEKHSRLMQWLATVARAERHRANY